MFHVSDNRAIFSEPIPEVKVLAFLYRNLISQTRVQPISKVISCYFKEIIFPAPLHTGDLSLAFSVWDNDPHDRNARLIAAEGFDFKSRDYPKILNYGQGIVGRMLAELNDNPNRLARVSSDYELDSQLAAAATVINELGFRAGIAFPMTVGGRLVGVFKLYSTMKFDESVGNDAARLRLESGRLSFVLGLAGSHFSSLIETRLAHRFKDIDTSLPGNSRDELMSRLEDTVKKCMKETLWSVDALRGAINLHSKLFAEVSLPADETPAKSDRVAVPLINTNAHGSQMGYLEVRTKRDGTYFSRLDQELVKKIAQPFSKYLSLYIALATEANKAQKQISRQKELLEICQEISTNLVGAKTREEIVDTLLKGINKSFAFSDLVFLVVEEGKLKPFMSIPDSTATRLNEMELTLDVLPECLVKTDRWDLRKDCPTCKACSGLTSIAVLQRLPLRVPNVKDELISDLYKDFGVRAKSEFILPLAVGKTAYGVLDMYRKDEGDIDNYEWFFLEAICNFAALAFYNRYLFDVLEEIQRQESRGEMARDVVHTLTPTTSSLITYAEHVQQEMNAIYQRPGENKTAVRHQLDRTMDQLHGLVDSIRQQENLIYRYEIVSRTSRQELEEVSLKEVIENVITLNSFRATKKRIRFRHEFEGTRRVIQVAEIDIYLILWNLIHNAVKFTRGTKPSTIHIKEKYLDQDVAVTVRDEGVGIKEEDRHHIWDAGFSTVAPGASRATSGIGLATVHELVEMMGWDIKERSKVNSGTEFTLIIRPGGRS